MCAIQRRAEDAKAELKVIGADLAKKGGWPGRLPVCCMACSASRLLVAMRRSSGHCRENKPFSNSNQSLVSPMVTRLGPVGFSQRPDPVRTFAGELAEDTFKQAKT